MSQTAFALKEGARGRFAGASVARVDGSTLDVAARLKAGRGYIVADDPAEVALLDGVDVLKRVAVSEAQQAAEAETKRSARKGEREEKR